MRRQVGDLAQVLKRHVAVVELAGPQRVELGGLARERHELELLESGLVGPRVGWVRDVHDVTCARVKLIQLPRPIGHLPERVGGVGAEVLCLRVQKVPDRVGAVDAAVKVPDRSAGRRFVPGVLRHHAELSELVVDDPRRVVLLVECKHGGMRVGVADAGEVVRDLTWNITAIAALVGDEHRHPEFQVAARDRLSVGPAPALHGDGRGLAV